MAAKKHPQEAQFGWDVVGEDGRRIFRGLPEGEARQQAARITSVTGEDLEVVAAEEQAPSVATPSPDPDFPPVADTLKDPVAD